MPRLLKVLAMVCAIAFSDRIRNGGLFEGSFAASAARVKSLQEMLPSDSISHHVPRQPAGTMSRSLSGTLSRHSSGGDFVTPDGIAREDSSSSEEPVGTTEGGILRKVWHKVPFVAAIGRVAQAVWDSIPVPENTGLYWSTVEVSWSRGIVDEWDTLKMTLHDDGGILFTRDKEDEVVNMVTLGTDIDHLAHLPESRQFVLKRKYALPSDKLIKVRTFGETEATEWVAFIESQLAKFAAVPDDEKLRRAEARLAEFESAHLELLAQKRDADERLRRLQEQSETGSGSAASASAAAAPAAPAAPAGGSGGDAAPADAAPAAAEAPAAAAGDAHPVAAALAAGKGKGKGKGKGTPPPLPGAGGKGAAAAAPAADAGAAAADAGGEGAEDNPPASMGDAHPLAAALAAGKGKGKGKKGPPPPLPPSTGAAAGDAGAEAATDSAPASLGDAHPLAAALASKGKGKGKKGPGLPPPPPSTEGGKGKFPSVKGGKPGGAPPPPSGGKGKSKASPAAAQQQLNPIGNFVLVDQKKFLSDIAAVKLRETSSSSSQAATELMYAVVRGKGKVPPRSGSSAKASEEKPADKPAEVKPKGKYTSPLLASGMKNVAIGTQLSAITGGLDGQPLSQWVKKVLNGTLDVTVAFKDPKVLTAWRQALVSLNGDIIEGAADDPLMSDPKLLAAQGYTGLDDATTFLRDLGKDWGKLNALLGCLENAKDQEANLNIIESKIQSKSEFFGGGKIATLVSTIDEAVSNFLLTMYSSMPTEEAQQKEYKKVEKFLKDYSTAAFAQPKTNAILPLLFVSNVLNNDIKENRIRSEQANSDPSLKSSPQVMDIFLNYINKEPSSGKKYLEIIKANCPAASLKRLAIGDGACANLYSLIGIQGGLSRCKTQFATSGALFEKHIVRANGLDTRLRVIAKDSIKAAGDIAARLAEGATPAEREEKLLALAMDVAKDKLTVDDYANEHRHLKQNDVLDDGLLRNTLINFCAKIQHHSGLLGTFKLAQA
eukprot:TRINITY_DN396_c1_g1_i1.p1 TRINITY_DN396_c1_g1~~TRINITY_DN396_c1_g1_i1.p1  ORF type:complete len:1023 (+),score=265.19 TRINITY_DN396_c1_g1_i1:68-3070(+)